MFLKGDIIVGETQYNKVYVGETLVFDRMIPVPSFIEATGGTITYSGDYTIHCFTGSGTFTVTKLGDTNTVDFLVVAGGGSKGGTQNYDGGGGGAGGLIYTEGKEVEVTSYSIVIGAGGPAPLSTQQGNDGNNSSALGTTVTGGGGGGRGADSNGQNNYSGRGGGSGGGAGGGIAYKTGGNGVDGQGYNGGWTNNGYYAGGGGAGGVGKSQWASPTGGPGVTTVFGKFSIGGCTPSYQSFPGCGGENSSRNYAGNAGVVYIRYKYK